ncbi:baeRF2 domain-containing protein [Streptomyces narbonensis]
MAVVVHYGGLPTAETHGWVGAGGGDWQLAHVHEVTPGERLRHRVPVATWHRTCVRLGHRLDERARRAHANAVVVGGDEWACNVLLRRLPHTLRDKTVRVGGPTPTHTGRALLEPQLDGVFRGRMAAHDRELVDVFIGRRALNGPVAEGLAATVTALQRGQVAALLLNRPPGSSPAALGGLATAHPARPDRRGADVLRRASPTRGTRRRGPRPCPRRHPCRAGRRTGERAETARGHALCCGSPTSDPVLTPTAQAPDSARCLPSVVSDACIATVRKRILFLLGKSGSALVSLAWTPRSGRAALRT